MTRFSTYSRLAGVTALTLAAVPAVADDDWRANYSLFGNQGIIDMPSAVAPPDGEIAATVSGFGGTERATFTFQILPRVTGSFRYSQIDDYDRSFDVQYQITDEGQYVPALAVGLRDFIGTGRYSSEYLVATKTISPNIRVTGGIGWGRLGSYNGFTNPLGILDEGFETRPDDSIVTGGTILSGQFFRGDASLFGGVEWRINDEWTALLEYSSDAYTREVATIGFDPQSPVNVGLKWSPSDTFELGAYYMHGTDIGFSATLIIDPKTRAFGGGLDSAPVPVANRSSADFVAAATWDNPQVETASLGALETVLQSDGFRLLGTEIVGSTMRVRYENTRYRSEAQGVGRVARILSQVAPANVETFVMEPTREGIALSAVTIQRSDLEQLENEPNAAARLFDRTTFSDAAGPAPATGFDNPDPAFQWGIAPSVVVTLFDGENPARLDLGVEASFEYELRPNLVLSGAYRQSLGGKSDELASIADSDLPDVRRNAPFYSAQGGGIENLSLSWYGRPAPDVYSRVSVGYFERMFGGVSGELLWKPVNSRLALGAEVNYTLLRDFDGGFGFRPICTNATCTAFADEDYSVVTGHLSAYYDLDNGFQAQLDVGRYLAGDVGATFSLDREFENGWKVGAYFTMTDVEFEDFGEGSFDKGIYIEIPLDGIYGEPTRSVSSTTLSSLERDGGARVRIQGRLYDVVEDGHQGMMAENWGRVWR